LEAGSSLTMSSNAIISGNTAIGGHGGGVYAAGNLTVANTGGSIASNYAPNGHGGGIYTLTKTYSNINLAAQTLFNGNTASELIDLGRTWAQLKALFPTIDTKSISPSAPIVHPLNDYDINVFRSKVTVYYVNENGVPIGSPTFAEYWVPMLTPFTLSGTDIPSIHGYTFIDWKIVGGNSQGNTTVILPNVEDDIDLFLIYKSEIPLTGVGDSNTWAIFTLSMAALLAGMGIFTVKIMYRRLRAGRMRESAR